MAGPWEKYANPSTRYGADPYKVAEEQRKAEANARANEAAARAATAAERANANSASANENTRIQTEIALATKGLTLALDGSIVARPGGPVGGKPPADPARIAKLNSLIDQINRTQQLYEAGPGETEGVKGIADYLPTDANVKFDTSGAQLSEKGLAAFRIPGSGTMTDRDAAMFERANMPTASTRDAGIEEQLRGIRSRVDAELEQLGLPPAKWEGVQQQLATGETRREVDPVASGIIDRMIRQGKSAEDINAVLGPLGFNPVGPGDVAAAQDYLRKNPKYDKSVGRAERTLPIENPTLNAALQTAPGTAAATYLNAGGFGIPQALNPQAFEALRDENPLAAFAGDVGGIITGTGLIGKAGQQTLGRVLPAAVTNNPTTLQKFANFGRQLAPDAAYGAVYGGVTEGDPLTGAATATLGSAGGQLIGKGLQKGFQGVSDPAVQYLTDRGIPLTLGQTLGNRGIMGRMANKMESVPVLGDMLARNRMDGLKAFEREALNDVVTPIGGRVTTGGTEGLQQAQGAVSQAYGDALTGVNVRPDAQFATEAQSAMQAGAAVPKFGEDFTYMMNREVEPVLASGQLSGPQLQSALQSLGKMRSGFSKNPDAMAGYAADATSQMDDALTGLVSRQSPDTMPAYNAAKGAFQRLAPFENARISGVNQEAITPAQLARAITNNTKSFGGRASAARGDNLTDLIRYAQEVLPSTVPNSGTADRGLAAFALPTALGGTAVGAEYFADNPGLTGTLAALAALSTKTGNKAAQAALTKRPKAIKRLGGIFGRREAQKGLAGMVTAPLLIED